MKKRIVSILLLVIMLFSICSCIKSKKKYDYNMDKYVNLGKYSGFNIEIPLDDIQCAIDTEIMAFATEYEIKEGDTVFVDITVTEVVYKDLGNGTLADQRGEEITELAEKDMKLVVGSRDYAARVEQAIIGTKVGETTKLLQFKLPSTFKVEKYRGQEVYIDITVKSKLCEIGDVVAVEFDGYYLDKDGKRIPNPDKKTENDNDYKAFAEASKEAFYLGTHTFDGFEEAIIGMKTGETKTIQIDVPDDYYYEAVRGQRAEFVIAAMEVFTPPVFDSDFIKTYCNYINQYYLDYRRYKTYTTTDEFVADLKKEYILGKIFENIDSEYEVKKYPKIEYRESLKDLKDMEETFKEIYGVDLDKYLDANFGQTREEYVKTNMSLEMIYYAIAQREGIEPTAEELLSETDSLIAYYKNLYMINNNLDEATAKAQAMGFVDELGSAYVYENALYKKIDDFLIKSSTINTLDKTYVSITETIADSKKPVEK